MTPDQLAKSGSEHAHQVATFAYCAVAHLHGFAWADEWAQSGKLPKSHDAPAIPVISRVPALPQLKWIHAIHNQGHGDRIRGAISKAEGVKSGIADIFLPYPVLDNHGEVRYCGLYIEMKKPSLKPKSDSAKGGLSKDQIAFGTYARTVGYCWVSAYSWREAANLIRLYLEFKE